MLHACFTPIALCFVYTSWHFYVFSGTNLLTRCHSASSYFLLFFYSRLLVKKIFSELDEIKAKVPIFWHVHGARRGDEVGKKGGHTWWWRDPPLGRTAPWCGPLWRPPTSPFRLYIAPDAKTLKEEASTHEKFRSAAAIEDKFRGTEISVPVSCRDRKLPPEPSPLTPAPFFITVADSHDEERVVLPRGRGLYR
jgi:hypothetical protein